MFYVILGCEFVIVASSISANDCRLIARKDRLQQKLDALSRILTEHTIDLVTEVYLPLAVPDCAVVL